MTQPIESATKMNAHPTPVPAHQHGVFSETGKLREVLVSGPDTSHALMAPKHVDSRSDSYLLFEDLLNLRVAKKEHGIFQQVLSSVATVKTFEGMLADLLKSRDCRFSLIDEVATLEGLSSQSVQQLRGMDVESLVWTLISGMPRGWTGNKALFEPLPNLMFTRDIAVAVFGSMVMCYAAHTPRKREMLMMRFLIRHYHKFRSRQKVDVNESETELVTIEGGDVMVVNSGLVLVGISARTQLLAAQRMARMLKDSYPGATFLGIDIPKGRSSMHLDTVATMISREEAVVFPGVTNSECDVHDLCTDENPQKGSIRELFSSAGVTDFIPCGGHDELQQRREQWTDGANTFCLAEGIVACYERNEETAREMMDRGYIRITTNVMEQDFKLQIEQAIVRGTKVFIGLPGSELSRGRGGPRCMSCPLLR